MKVLKAGPKKKKIKETTNQRNCTNGQQYRVGNYLYEHLVCET